jgi:hypothetical protein
MRTADWPTPDDLVAEPAGDQTTTAHRPSWIEHDPALRAARNRDDDGATIELRLYLPRRAWRFTVTRIRVAPVSFRDIIRTDNDDHETIPSPSLP